MAQSTLNVRMDDKVKKDFDLFCTEVGLNASVAVNLLVRTVLRERRIPFEITDWADPFYSPSNLQRLQSSIDEYRSGRVVEKTTEKLERMAQEEENA